MLLGVLFFAVGLGVVVYALAATRQVVAAQPTAIEVALGEAAAPDRDPRDAASTLYRALEPALALGGRLVRRVSPQRQLDLLRRRIVLAGLEGTLTVERMLSYKAGAVVLGVLLGLLLGGPGRFPTAAWAVLLGVLASIVPDVVLGSRADARQSAVARDLPESLDLLALTVEAGLGLEQALEVVVEEGRGPLSVELTRMLREIELGVPRREALGALRERTDVPDLSSFVVALVQADEVGTSVGEVLKAQAAQVRLKRRQRAREQAGKTPVKILFPLVLGVFPALFVVAIGPGALTIAEVLLGR